MRWAMIMGVSLAGAAVASANSSVVTDVVGTDGILSTAAAASDAIEDTVNYASLSHDIVTLAEGTRYYLVEKLVSEIAWCRRNKVKNYSRLLALKINVWW